ncbi:Transposase IS116/IS110/IS902 family protein [Arthrobacter sp. ok909]|nr:Transposase IS116/IS110/IS902 family protein [Arthrobacter sp. ok909]
MVRHAGSCPAVTPTGNRLQAGDGLPHSPRSADSHRYGPNRTTIQAQEIGADIVAALARTVLDLHDEVAKIDKQIETRFREHQQAEILLSMPGFGTLRAAELLAATGGDITAYDSAARLAGDAGQAPVPRDSGRISGNHHRPKRYDRRLLNVFYLAAQSAARYCPQSRTYYQRKRTEGKDHKQAVLSLARRRLNVLWAMLRDSTPYRQPTAPVL